MKKKTISILASVGLLFAVTTVIYLYYNTSGDSIKNNTLSDIIATDTISNNYNVTETDFDANNRENEEISYVFSKVFYPFGYENTPSFSELAQTEDFLLRLKSLNATLHDNFDYYEFSTQPLHFFGKFNRETEFLNSPDLTDTINQEVNINGEDTFVTAIKNVIIDKKSYRALDEIIDEGRNFESRDFSIDDENAPVNIILGNAYSKYYKVGDMLDISLYSKAINFTVVGFCIKDAVLNYNSGEAGIALNYCVIMPFFDILYTPNDEQEEYFQTIYYCMGKNEGVIRVEKTDAGMDVGGLYKEKIEDLAKKYDLFYTLSPTEAYLCFWEEL